MLAGEQTVGRDDRMLVVGYAQEDGVDRLVGEHLAVVVVGLHLLDNALLRIARLDDRLAVGRAHRVVVAHGRDDAPVGELLNAGHVHRVRDAAIADHRDVDLAVGEERRRAAVE